MRNSCRRLADLMIKYFNIWWNSQNSEGLDKAEYFFNTYKEMKNIVQEDLI